MIRILAVVGCLLWWSGLAHAIPVTVMDNDNLSELKGLDRADQVAGEHGDQGRAIARQHHTTFSVQSVQSVQNGNFTTQLVGLPPSTIHGATLDSPNIGLGGDPPLTTPVSIPEATSLLLLSSGLVGLWFLRARKC